MFVPVDDAQKPAYRSESWFIDVRTHGEFATAWIPGSINVPLHDVNENMDQLTMRARERRLVLVCRSGARAEKARELLVAGGVANIDVLAGGLDAWQVGGAPTEQGRATRMSLERQVRIAAGFLVLVGAVLGLLVDSNFVFLAAFIGAGLVFAGITDTCGMGMLLARMPWNGLRGPQTN